MPAPTSTPTTVVNPRVTCVLTDISIPRPSNLVVDDAVDVEVQQDGTLATVDEVADRTRAGLVVEDAEVDVVVALAVEHPADHGSGAGSLEAQRVVDLVQEHVPAGGQQVVEVVLLGLE